MFKNRFKLLFRFLKYLLTAKHAAGHGIHSPFVFNFVTDVLFTNENENKYKLIKSYKKELYKNTQKIELKDIGAGSSQSNKTYRRVNKIARTSSTRHKYGKLLTRMVSYYKPEVIVELGTALGIGSCYLNINLDQNAKFYSIEADFGLYNIAKQYFNKYFENKAIIINSTFEAALPQLLSEIKTVDFVYFDGNHKKKPTIEYFEKCLEKIANHSIFVFDDIHWSDEMEEAWEYIKSHAESRVCIDLFQIGIVFFRKELSCENYVIRY